MTSHEFNDKVVLVTGATGNLGGAVARAFHQAGDSLALVGRQPGFSVPRKTGQTCQTLTGAVGSSRRRSQR